MTFNIVWPAKLTLTDPAVETLFIEAVANSLIPPQQIPARTPKAMADALQEAGIIWLAGKR